MSLLEGGPVVFVDVETNGMSHVSGHVIEVGAIRVENGVVTRTFNKLIDPGVPVPSFITRLTGISSDDLRDAPSFADIADELHELLSGALFVAHNVRFDYSFLKQEFKRVGKVFLPKQLCTVKLSRALYPEQSSHKLQSLIDRHGFAAPRRHRAFGDAHVLWQFLQHVEQAIDPVVVQAAVTKQLKSPSIPKAIDPSIIKNLPETPGVYIFEDAAGKPLYVGKSINIKKRVMQHFGADHAVRTEYKIAQSIAHVRYVETPGELAALLLESQLVKELQPLHNKRLRKVEKLVLARQVPDTAGYAHVALEEAGAIDPAAHSDVLAIYPRRGKARQSFDQLIHDFDLCPKLFGLEKGAGACFQYQLHRCRGACIGKEPAAVYNTRLHTAFERSRIQARPYKNPMLLVEKQAGDTELALVVDQWCVLAEIKHEEHCEPVVTLHDKAFDPDTYKILTSFLTAKLDKLWLRPFPLEQLQAMQSGA